MAQTLAERMADLMKVEILRDMVAGRVPADAPSFSDLHDYVDANEYVIDAAAECGFDWSAGSDEDMAVMNASTDLTDAWLKARAAIAAVDYPRRMTQ